MEKVRSASQLRQAEAAKDAKRKLNKDKKRIAELDTIIKKLYECSADQAAGRTEESLARSQERRRNQISLRKDADGGLPQIGQAAVFAQKWRYHAYF